MRNIILLEGEHILVNWSFQILMGDFVENIITKIPNQVDVKVISGKLVYSNSTI